MWKLLIAEDEYEIRDGLCNYVDWGKLNIELAETTNNGKAALDYMLNNHVDILLTDIVMPYMDGIELIKEMKKNNIETIPVIISVHWDKDYLKSAFKLEVMDYILKPINLKELYATMEKITAKCEKMREYNNKRLDLEKRLKEMEPILKERLLYKLISGSVYNKDVLKKHIRQIGLSINAEEKCIFVLLRSSGRYESDLERGDMLNLAVEDFLPYVESNLDYLVVSLNENDVGIIFSGAKTSDYEYMEDVIGTLSVELNKIGLDIIAGIGQHQTEISEISFSRKQAEKALDYSSFFVHNEIFLYNDMLNMGIKETYPENIIEDIVKKANLGNVVGAEEDVETMFEKLIERYKSNEPTIKQICLDLINRVSNISDIRNNVFTPNMFIKINRMQTISELKIFVKSFCAEVAEKQYTVIDEKYNSLVESILSYIDDNLSDNITLKTLADKFYFSPNYISTLFKKHNGLSFSQYMVNARIEKSKKLMENMDMKLYNIAQAVGYDDADYFSKKFKQVTGTSPSQWRIRLGGKKQ